MESNLAVSNSNYGRIKALMKSSETIERFAEVLGNAEARPYVSSVLLVVANDQRLMECTPQSILTAAYRAATLRLSCDPSTGHAWLIPRRNKGVQTATFQVGYKGLYSIAIRTGKYRYINVGPVYEGEEVVEDRITGFLKIEGRRTGNKVIGYIAAFELFQGLAKAIYDTVENLNAHGKKYSPAYDKSDGLWQTSNAAMCKKTILIRLLSHWGYIDPNDRRIIEAIEAEGDAGEIVEIEAVDAEEEEPAPKSQLMAELGFEEAGQGRLV